MGYEGGLGEGGTTWHPGNFYVLGFKVKGPFNTTVYLQYNRSNFEMLYSIYLENIIML